MGADSQLDRILREYRLPYDWRSLLGLSKADPRMVGEVLTPSKLRHAKVRILFEYLGAMRVMDEDRMRRGLD